MLVLSRKRFESIQIGDDVLVKVIETGRNSVKIGIQAPDDIRVVRAELVQIPGPQHPLAVFLAERRALRMGRRRNQPGSTEAPAEVEARVAP